MLRFPYSFHNHSTYCDGRATLSEMAEAAFSLGIRSYAFTGHLYDPADARWSMTDEGAAAYRSEIAALKKQYAGKMDILCGAEADLFATQDLSPYELIIASVHCFHTPEGCVMTDQKPAHLYDLTRRYYGGDIYAMLRAFYELEASIAKMPRHDIIGHLDYVSKFNLNNAMFDENDKRYISAWNDALDALIPLDAPFEINVSPYYRKRLDRFYPSEAILREIFRRGGSVTITGDCHETDNLGLAYDEAVNLAKRIGFRTARIFTAEGQKEFVL